MFWPLADKTAFPPNGVATLASVILPVSSNSSPTTVPSILDPGVASDFAETDLELITTAASLLEGLSIDLDLAKHDIAFAPYPPASSSSSDTLLGKLFDFVELASPPAYWGGLSEDGGAFGEKGFATVKSAVMRAVVEAPNSDGVMNRLFSGEGKSWVVEKLVGWVRKPKEGREDLLICAAHMLAALGRKGKHRFVPRLKSGTEADCNLDRLQTSTASSSSRPTTSPPPSPRSPPPTPSSSSSRQRRARARRPRSCTASSRS